MTFFPDSYYNFTAVCGNQGINQYNWWLCDDCGTIEGGQGTNAILVRTGYAGIWLTLKVGNECGWSPELERIGSTLPDPGGMQFVISPNPADNDITITPNEKQNRDSKKAKVKRIKSIKIINNFGVIQSIKHFENETMNTTVNISNLPTGIYMIQINEGVNLESHTIIKK